MEFVANESKKVEIETSTGVYQRHAIQTHFVQIGENYIDLIERYVKPLYEEGDLLSISEKVIALCQKRIVYRKDIHPGFWAKLLCRFVHVTPAGPGAGTPHKMQLIIMISNDTSPTACRHCCSMMMRPSAVMAMTLMKSGYSRT